MLLLKNELKKEIEADLKLLTKNNRNWKDVGSFGRFISIQHTKYAPEKYSSLTEILQKQKSKDAFSQAKNNKLFLFGDKEIELTAGLTLKHTNGSHIEGSDSVDTQLVIVGNQAPESQDIDFKIKSPSSLCHAIEEISKKLAVE